MILGLLGIILAIYSLIFPQYDHLFVPILLMMMAAIFIRMGLSVWKGNHKTEGILLIMASGLLMTVTLAKLIIN